METPYVPTSRYSDYKRLYVSSASIVGANDEIHGACARQQWLRLNNLKRTDPSSFRSEAIFSCGNGIERELTYHLKRMNRWLGNSIKIYHEDMNMSGEVDIIAYDSDGTTPVIIECKTFGGANPFTKRELMGERRKNAKPKTAHLLQLGLYLYMKDDSILLEPRRPNGLTLEESRELLNQCTYGYITYIDRNEPTQMSEFKVWIDNNMIIYQHEYAKTSTTFCSMDDVKTRATALNEAVQTGVAPPRDFHSQYDKETIDRLARAGKLGSSQTQIHAQGGHVVKGDWQCKYHINSQGEHDYLYCSYGKLCELEDHDMLIMEDWVVPEPKETVDAR
jgi:hypothetical protein